MEPRRFIKKPVVIEAIQFIETSRTQRKHGVSIEHNDMDVANFMCKCLHVRTVAEEGNQSGRTYIEIPTLEGDMEANVGDWIIKEIDGEYYPCKPHIFEATYKSLET